MGTREAVSEDTGAVVRSELRVMDQTLEVWDNNPRAPLRRYLFRGSSCSQLLRQTAQLWAWFLQELVLPL